MTINERIKQLRKEELMMTQNEFAAELNIARSTLTGIELGKASVTDRIISDICGKFNVNTDWIRYGDLPVFKETTLEEELSGFFGDLLSSNDPNNDFKKRVIKALSKFGPDEWKALDKMLDILIEEKNKKK